MGKAISIRLGAMNRVVKYEFFSLDICVFLVPHPISQKEISEFHFLEWVMWSDNLWEKMPVYAALSMLLKHDLPSPPTGLQADGLSRSAQTLTPFHP